MSLLDQTVHCKNRLKSIEVHVRIWFFWSVGPIRFCHVTLAFVDFLDFGRRSLIQWNLSTMTFDMQYFFDYKDFPNNIVINNNQTLLALKDGDKCVNIFSMETGIRISRYEREG